MARHPLIESVLRRLGVEDATPGPEGEYEVVFDAQLDLQILPLEGSLILVRSSIGTVPPDRGSDSAFLASLLRRNLANLRRQSELVTIDRESRTVWLYRLVRPQADSRDAPALLSILEEFLDSLEWWRATAEDRPSASDSPFQFLRP